MKRIDEIERRLLNWARWKHGMTMGGLGFSSIDLTLANAGDDRDRESRIPTLDVEASITDEGVGQLPTEERDAVFIFYLRGSGHAEKARVLGCSQATMCTRVIRAHHKLQAWISERERRAADARRTIEAKLLEARQLRHGA